MRRATSGSNGLPSNACFSTASKSSSIVDDLMSVLIKAIIPPSRFCIKKHRCLGGFGLGIVSGHEWLARQLHKKRIDFAVKNPTSPLPLGRWCRAPGEFCPTYRRKGNEPCRRGTEC